MNNIVRKNPEFNIKIINKKNGGHSSATNEGIRACTSEYIALVDADDLWHPSKLEKQMAIFKNSTDPLLGVVHTDYICIDQSDAPIDSPTIKPDPKNRGRVFENLIRQGNFITGSNSAVMMKKQVFQDHGFFDENLRCGEDFEMWLRIAQTYHYDFVPEVLTYIRRHPSALSNQKMLHCRSDLYIINKWKKEYIEVGGLTLIADYLSRTTFTNLYNITFTKEFRFILDQLQDTINFKMPRLFILWACGRKFRKKIVKIFKSLT